MFKQFLNTLRSKIKGGSTDAQGNYYSPADDEKLALRQTRMQQVQQANPTGIQGTETPNNASRNVVYDPVVKPQAKFQMKVPKLLMPAVKKQYEYKSKIARAPKPTATPTPTPTPTPAMPDMTDFEKKTLPTFKKFDIHPAVAYAIAQAEGGKRNKFNIGAFDSNPKAAPIFASEEAQATAAAKLLSSGRYAKAYEQRKNPRKMIEEIKKAGYAGDPKTWKARSAASGGAGKTYDSWDQFVADTKAYKKWLYR